MRTPATLCCVATIASFAASCAEEWFGGERLRCAVAVSGGSEFPFRPGTFDERHDLAPIVDGACADGAEPHPELEFSCSDAVGPCACRFVCEPQCTGSQFCTEDARCECAPAYVEGLFGCEWPGLVEAELLDTCEGWTFLTSPGNNPTSMLADIEGGKLQLSVTMPCTGAAARTAVRLPARDTMPDGAALVFEYTATETVGADPSQGPAIEVGIGRTRFTLAAAAEPRTHRECVELEAVPMLGTFGAVVQRFGACFPEDAHDWQLRIDNIRLEPDSDC